MTQNILHMARHDTRHLVIAKATGMLPEQWTLGTPWTDGTPWTRPAWFDPEELTCHAAILTAGNLEGRGGHPLHPLEVSTATSVVAEVAMEDPRSIAAFMQALNEVAGKYLAQYMPSDARICKVFGLRPGGAFANAFDTRPRHLDADAIHQLVGRVPVDPYAFYCKVYYRAKRLGAAA